MPRTRAALVVLLLIAILPGRSHVQEADPRISDINAQLMEATFKLEGRDSQGQVVFGSAFLMGRPFANNPNRGRYVLITAAHVLDDMKGEYATVHTRKLAAPDKWVRVPFSVQIRAGNRPLFVRLPDADVAVMYVKLPTGVRPPLISTDRLADDEMLKKYEIHPGDEVKCLGYPLSFESNEAGFPILRSGNIASYPLVPTEETRTFLLDFKVFKGNSGGPAYFVDFGRSYGGKVYVGGRISFIIGLVSKEGLHSQHIRTPYSEEIRRLQLDLGMIVHASQIRRAIESLPSPSEEAGPDKQ